MRQKRSETSLDQNEIERDNHSYSYLRRDSLAFGSVRALDNQAIFVSLIQSAKKHNLNIQEYMEFLLQQMAIIGDSIVKTRDSKDYELYRKMLPDRYAQTHKSVVQTYEPPTIPEGPLNPGAKRCGYKKQVHNESSPSPDPNPDVG